MISHALVSLGVMSSPLGPYVKKPRKKLLEEHHSLSEEWFSWSKRWFETSTLRPTTRLQLSGYYFRFCAMQVSLLRIF